MNHAISQPVSPKLRALQAGIKAADMLGDKDIAARLHDLHDEAIAAQMLADQSPGQAMAMDP